MPQCTICGEKIPDGSRTCSICGSSADEFFPSGTMLTLEPAPVVPAALPPGGRYCPVCAKVYGPEHADNYCTCGTELLKDLPKAERAEEVPMATFAEEGPMAPILDDIPVMSILEVPEVPIRGEAPMVEEVKDTAFKVRGQKPPSGTPCLVLYDPDKQPLQYFAL